MALADLSKVTDTLMWLLEAAMPLSSAWPTGETASVSPLPPDLMPNNAQLGLYLYHVTEDPHLKNDPGTSFGSSNRERPLALNLYYLLTVAKATTDSDALRAQTLLGIAMRVLYDYAILTDDSTVTIDPILGPQQVFAAMGLQGRQNRLRITLRPVPPDDAVDYWTAGDAPLRLAAYYQVSVVLLEPEPVVTAAGTVLQYGTGILPVTAPSLTGSRSKNPIVVGAESAARTVVVTPAQVTVPGPGGAGDFEVSGSQLMGEGTTLRLRGDFGTFDVDGAVWGVVASADRVFARVAPDLGAIPTMPGTWAVSVLVRRTLQIGDSAKTIVHASNETPILIVPRLDGGASGPSLGDRSRAAAFTLTGWRFTGSEVIPSDAYPLPSPTHDPTYSDPRGVQLYVGGVALVRRSPLDPLAAGEFAVLDDRTLSVFLPADLPINAVVLVQVRVNSASSGPYWLRVVP